MKFNIQANTSSNYLQDVKAILQQARDFAYSSVNSAMVQAYWLIGKRIVLEEQDGKDRAKYGKYVIKNLTTELSNDFGSVVAEQRLREYRKFYIGFSIDNAIRHSLSGELEKTENQRYKNRGAVSPELDLVDENTRLNYIFTRLSWTHIRHLLRVSDKKVQTYYIKETVENHWSTRTLDRNIASQYYERLLLSQNKETVKKEMQEKTGKFQHNKLEFIKNPAVLEFLKLSTNMAYTESDLEKAITNNLQQFILEMGKGFAFVERQKLIRTENRDYFIDLVFYNYILKCFVLIDLKTERITHQDVGQMDMYVRMFNEKEKNESDNPTLGIVLCSETDQDIARYSILKGNEQIFATKYKLYLPTEEELRAEIEREKLNLKLQLGKRND